MHPPEHPRPWSIGIDDADGRVRDNDGRSVATFGAEDDTEFPASLVEIVNEHDRDRDHEISTPGISP